MAKRNKSKRILIAVPLAFFHVHTFQWTGLEKEQQNAQHLFVIISVEFVLILVEKGNEKNLIKIEMKIISIELSIIIIFLKCKVMLNIADEFLIYLYMESVIWMIEIEKCAFIMEERERENITKMKM